MNYKLDLIQSGLISWVGRLYSIHIHKVKVVFTGKCSKVTTDNKANVYQLQIKKLINYLILLVALNKGVYFFCTVIFFKLVIF